MKSPHKMRSVGWLALGVAALAFQLACLAVDFPLSAALSSEPLLRIDSGYHWYQIWAARELGAQGLLFGYDPALGAGYLTGIHTNGSAKIPSLYAGLVGQDANPTIVYKVFAVLTAAVAPLAMVFAARALRLTLMQASMATLFAWLLWWTSMFRVYHGWGMVSYTAAVFLAMPALCFGVQQWTRRISASAALMHGAGNGIGVLFHPLWALVYAIPAGAFVLVHLRRVNWVSVSLFTLSVAVITIAVNWIWIDPALGRSTFDRLSEHPYQKAVGLQVLATHYASLHGGGLLRWSLLLLAAFGAAFADSKAERTTARWLMLAAALLFGFAAYGAAIPILAESQPNRFSIAGVLFTVPAAAIGISKAIQGMATRSVDTFWRLVNGAILVCALGVIVFFIRETLLEVQPGTHPHYGPTPPEVRGEGPNTRWLREQITARTDPDDRVLVEHSLRLFDMTHVVGYLRAKTNRELLGGVYLTTGLSGFESGRLFGRPIEDYSVLQMEALMRGLNVRLVVATSEASVRALSTMPFARMAESSGGISLFELDTAAGLFLKGKGRVRSRGLNRLEVADLEGREVVLKYNFLAGVTTRPEVQVEPYLLDGWPYPLVRLVNPPRDVTIGIFPK